jgi:diguanylate cyclase (GGDEF)-like protein
MPKKRRLRLFLRIRRTMTRYRLSVQAATLALMICVFAATAVIVVATKASASQHDDARMRADRAIGNSALYQDTLAGAYNEWVMVVAYFSLKDPLYLEGFSDARRTVEESLSALRRDAIANDPDSVRTIDSFIDTHSRFAAADQDVITAITEGDLAGAVRISTETGVTVDSVRFLGDLRSKIEEQRAELVAAQEQQRAAETTTLRWSLGIGAMCAGLMILAAFASYRWIARPLHRARAATRAIAAGDPTARVQRSGPAELAGLADDVNFMANALIHRSEELNAYLSKDLEARTGELERANAELSREVEERRRAEESLARALEAERELEEQLRHQAFHDPLTSLANRARFMDRLDHALQRAARTNQEIAVIFMDIDDFKAVNDSLGHPIGDRLLIDVARRLEGNLRPGDTAARFGGDEFAVLLEDVRGAEEATAVAQRIIESLRTPLVLNDKEVFVRASMGIASGRGHDGADELLRRADVAMYVAKSDGKGRFAVYDVAMERSIVGRLEMAGELQRAVERGEFVLQYQPSITLESGRISGVEALLRWRHPVRGLLAPAEFVPVAEETGLILPIGRWVLREACIQARRWQQAFPSDPPFTMAVNISARQVHQPGLLGVVAEALSESGIDPNTLVLEITESLMMQDADLAIARLNELKQLGVRLAIDDFGTGYSSLSYLRRFPVDILKIDKSFVDGVSHKGKEQELAQSIIELGQTLHLEIVAEGVEHAEQLGWLQSRHCDLGQGFLFSEPIDAGDLTRMLEDAAHKDTPLRHSA